MLNLVTLGSIDFAKGCYLGQEIVARAQHRGKVKRSLRILSWAGTSPPQIGGELVADSGRAVGSVIQVVSKPAVCLAVLNEDSVPPFSQAGSKLAFADQ